MKMIFNKKGIENKNVRELEKGENMRKIQSKKTIENNEYNYDSTNDSGNFTPLKDSICTADKFSSKLPVTGLYGAPHMGVNTNLHGYKNNINSFNNDIVIILTSTVFVNENKICIYQKNKNERIKTYLESIEQWLYNTSFKIILVENSGYNFNELNNEKELFKHRFEVISFDEKTLKESKYLLNNDSKGASEIFSINYAFYNSKLIKKTDFIIKITARYYIPEFYEYIKNYDLQKYDCLTQNDTDRCEMVGCHYKHFANFFNVLLLDKDKKYNGHIEAVWKFRTTLYKNILRCKIFNIKETQRGGLDETFTTI